MMSKYNFSDLKIGNNIILANFPLIKYDFILILNLWFISLLQYDDLKG